MSHDHSHQDMSTEERVAAARATCEAAGERFTALRAHVFELIIEDGGAVKAYDLLDRLRPEVGSPSKRLMPLSLAITDIADISQNFLSARHARRSKSATPMTMLIVSRKGFKSIAPLLSITAHAENAPRKTPWVIF